MPNLPALRSNNEMVVASKPCVCDHVASPPGAPDNAFKGGVGRAPITPQFQWSRLLYPPNPIISGLPGVCPKCLPPKRKPPSTGIGPPNGLKLGSYGVLGPRQPG